MDIEAFREYCLSLPFTSEGFPFGGDTLVFYVGGKIFALTDINEFKTVNLKCDPAKAIELREQYTEVIPGYHMNKKHWNTVDLHGTLPKSLISGLIKDSYTLVYNSLPKKIKEELKESQ